MLIASDESWCVLTPPKTASTALSHYFSAHPEFGVKTTPKAMHTMEPPEGAKVLLIVRNPFTRATSLWRHRLGELQVEGEEWYHPETLQVDPTKYTFLTFMDEVREQELDDFFWRTLTEWTRWVEVDQVLQFENLHADLQAALPMLDWEKISIPFRNRNPILTENHPLRQTNWGQQVKHFLPDPLKNPEAQRLVRVWAREDFGNYDYPLEYHG